jgi:hypothetical protein
VKNQECKQGINKLISPVKIHYILLLSYQIPIPGINYVALDPKSESWFDFNIEQLETKRSNEV